MDRDKMRLYIKLYWVRILVITLLSLLVLSLVFALIASVKAWIGMESFYKEQMKASIGFQLYLSLITAIIFGAIYTYMWYWMMFRGGGMSEFTKLQNKAISGADVGINWSDVIGMDEAKREAWEAVELIREKTRVKDMGGQIIKGILLVGPPGVGKTYLAKAIATECGMPFLSVVGSELEGMIVGLGAMKIRKLFKSARELGSIKGGCIIFIDEVDSIARPRTRTFGLGGGESYNMAVNQLLAEMDGLRQKDLNIVIIGATNVPEEELEPALMRAGRFDRKIYIGPPNLEDRANLFRYYLNKVKFNKETVKIDRLARLTVGNTPADIANIVRESSLIAARKKVSLIGMTELEESREKIAMGIRLNIKMSDKDKMIAAYHEAGHVVVTYLLVPTKDVFKASIIPHKTFGGSTWMVKKEESYIPDKDDLLGEIKILLSGYCAEKVKFGITSSGVSNDLKEANEIADKMVTHWGMGTSGANSVTDSPTSFRSHELAERDKDDIITNCFNEVHDLLRKELVILEKMAKDLLLKEELDYDAIENIFQESGKTRLMEKESKKSEKVVSWNDVIGMEEPKLEAMEIVSLIKDRAELQQIGGRIIRGLLMFGPPGCGKTYLASAMANEAGLPFLNKVGSEFVEMYVGVGASRIRHLFQEARELALSKGGCIIFIDEIDALGAKRAMETGGGGQTEHNQTLNQLLAELDGLKEKNEQYNIVVIGATNAREDFMDVALLRPGRFDRKLYVDLPGLEDREKLFDYYLQKVKFNPEEINSQRLARVTATWSPADIANLTREAALITVRNKKEKIGLQELDEARERIELGLKRKIKLSDEDRQATAYHEAGHAIITHFFAPKKEIYKLSIIPRKQTMGVAWVPEKQESIGRDKSQLLASIKIYLGGYVAEKLRCNATSDGVDSDFSGALYAAHKMVWSWGMGKSGYIGNFYSLFTTGRSAEPLMSEEMKAKLDNDVQEIMQTCLKDAESLMLKEIKLLDTLALRLLAKEELNYEEIKSIFKECGKEHPA